MYSILQIRNKIRLGNLKVIFMINILDFQNSVIIIIPILVIILSILNIFNKSIDLFIKIDEIREKKMNANLFMHDITYK